MARGNRGYIYISTDPNNNVPIGTPGVGVFIGAPGPTIYNGNGGASPTGDMLRAFGVEGFTFSPETIVPTVEF